MKEVEIGKIQESYVLEHILHHFFEETIYYLLEKKTESLITGTEIYWGGYIIY